MRYWLGVGGFLSILLGGCVSQPERNIEQADMTNPPLTAEERTAVRQLLQAYPEHQRLLNDWAASQNDVVRLVELEGELKILIMQLNALANTTHQEAPPAEVEQTKQALPPSTPVDGAPLNVEIAKLDKVEAPAEVAPDNNNDKVSSPTPIVSETFTSDDIAGKFGVQLAAMEDKQKLVTVWQQLSELAPDVFSPLIPRYQMLSKYDDTLYRLKTGLFNERAGADELCRRIRALERVCIVSRYDGSESAL